MPSARVVQQHQPDIDRHAALVDQLAQHVALAEQAVGYRLDGAIARGVGLEIDRAILGEIDFAGLAMRAHELAGMVAAGDRHRVEAETAELAVRRPRRRSRRGPRHRCRWPCSSLPCAPPLLIRSAPCTGNERLLEGTPADFHRLAVEIDRDRLQQGRALPGQADDVLEDVVAVDLFEHGDVGRRADGPRWPSSGRLMASAGRFDDMPITSGSVSPQLSSLLIVCSRS